MIALRLKVPALPRQSTAAARAALLLAAALSCAGCGLTAKTAVKEDVSVPLDYRQRHPIAIREADRTMEVFVGAQRPGLSAAQRKEVAVFASVWRKEATGGIIIDTPVGTHNARASHEVAREIRSMLGHAGVPPTAVVIRNYKPSDPGQLATVRLNYPKMTAQAGPCGLWPEDLGLPADAQPAMNRPYWNLGCSTQRNLAAMVENPADLVQPREEAPIYAARRTTVMEKYRAGQSPATVYPDDKKGVISDVGQQ